MLIISAPKMLANTTYFDSVKVHAVALNPVDALYVSNLPCGPGRTVGSDIAGTVDKVGDGVKGWRVGDRIAGLLQGG